MLSDRERRNIELTKAWEWSWNHDVDRMVDDCYAPDCIVVNMYSGYEIHGREALREIEHVIAAFDGTRRMKITDIVASGDVVAIQSDLVFGCYEGKAVAFLTFNDDGQIVSDNTYGEDPSGASIPATPELESAPDVPARELC